MLTYRHIKKSNLKLMKQLQYKIQMRKWGLECQKLYKSKVALMFRLNVLRGVE